MVMTCYQINCSRLFLFPLHGFRPVKVLQKPDKVICFLFDYIQIVWDTLPYTHLTKWLQAEMTRETRWQTNIRTPNTASWQALALFFPHKNFHLICHLHPQSECKSLKFYDNKELHFISECQGSLKPCSWCCWCNGRNLNHLISLDVFMWV